MIDISLYKFKHAALYMSHIIHDFESQIINYYYALLYL